MAEVQERKVEPMSPNGLQLAEQRRNLWTVVAAKGVEPDDLLEPAWWAHHAGKLAPYDKIEVRAEDGTWYAELIVTDSSRAWARVRPLFEIVRLTTSDVSQSQSADLGVEVIHRGPRKWSVVRKKDRSVLVEELAQRDDAEQWIKENSDKLKATA